MIAGIEIENVDPSKTLSINIVIEQNKAVGDVSEWLYRGRNSMVKVKTNETVEKETDGQKRRVNI